MSCEKSFDQDESVDPRVQIELERLNTATDEINKLEVDLDEARNQFRQLLAESTVRIDTCAKKLGNCIEKARPYYDARLKAKEALQETQKAAVNFERANSAHAAAKEMVYLAEEGLKTEGRTFDHAWQEMLNHATMRVNESESERTRSELEHRRTSQNYQRTEIRVQTLQKDLKRAITKSRPYFELKIHYNQLLEQQKNKVKSLEKSVSQVKISYAETLRNLEQISDEIHKTRQNGKSMTNELGTRYEGVGAESDSGNGYPSSNTRPNLPNSISGCAKATNGFQNDSRTDNNVKTKSKGDVTDGRSDLETGKLQATSKMLTPLSETSTTKLTPNTSGSSQPDTDLWSESSDTGNTEGVGDGDSCTNSVPSENDSSMTGPPDSESDDEFFKLPDKLSCLASPNVHKTRAFFASSPEFKNVTAVANSVPRNPDCESNEHQGQSSNSNSSKEVTKDAFFEGVGICSFPVQTELNLRFTGAAKTSNRETADDQNSNSCWTEIKLRSPEEEQFLTMRKNKLGKNKSDLEEDFDIPYAPLSEVEGDFNVSLNPLVTSPVDKKTDDTERETNRKTKLDNSVSGWMVKNSKNEESSEDPSKSSKSTPKKLNIRRQSLDVLWSNATGEKVKEILSHSIMKLSIGSLTERRSSESRISDDSERFQEESPGDNVKGNDSSYESNLSSQFGLQFFSKKNTKAEEEVVQNNVGDELKTSSPQDSFSNQIGGFISRKDRFFTKKVPSPLEKTLGYLNADEESNSDSESLASMDMLTDEQLSALVLDQDLTEIYQDIIS